MNKIDQQQTTEDTPTRHVLVSAGIWFAICCWGGAYVAARYLLHPAASNLLSLSPIQLASLRFGIASLFFVFPLVQAILRQEVSYRDLFLMVVVGQLTFSLYYWLQYIGIQQTNASIASILGVGLIPLFTALLAFFLRMERPNIPLVGALILGFLGVVLIVFQQPLIVSLHSGFFLGALCLIGNTFSFALYSILSKQWMQRLSPIVLTAGTMISGEIGLIILSLLDPSGSQWNKLALLDTTQWLALLFLAIGCSVLAYFAYNVALSKMRASRVTFYFFFEPLVSILLGITLLDEHLTWQVIVGALSIGAAMVLVNQSRT